MEMTKVKLSALFIALVPLLGSPVIHAETTAAPVLENRAAQGDITTPGGARRLTGDQTEALRASLINKPAKNVILLIGDGMGDSEITAARNYAQGAGGFFKGIDALPLTGQYTHYSLDKKTGKPDYVTDSAASATAWTTGVKTYNGALGVDIHENAHQTILEQAEARGYQIVTDAASLAAATDASQAKPLLGLFADGNMPVRWEGPKASYHGNIDKAPVTCTPNPKRDASVPTLAQMTEKAIDLLSRNEKGFFLQVEGASIDKQDHAANPCGQIGETVDLDEAVQKALEFARKDGNTLVIVTADHAHASQIIPADSKAPGLTQALNTHDGAVMVMSYGNSEEESMEHTGTQLRIAAYGPHAANVVGLTDQTDLFSTMKAALSLK
ncbi:alkaline phosphatase [Klebsiella variicola]|uniref:alkaline phosphatase n=1 Tax=Klebsiella variicola TaxID=244366 RepID=UPI0015E8D244|nr:alkaline phosphatase [Klebsiella variicola]